MPRARPSALALALAAASCLEVNPGYLGPTTGTSSEATGSTGGGSTGGGSTTGGSTDASTKMGMSGGGSGSGVPAGCGDGIVDADEACDDGQNGDQDDGCTDFCALPACGDDFVQASLDEQCDEGALNADDGACTSQCLYSYCGDGLMQAGVEACDDGNQVSDDGCEPDCTKLTIVKMELAADTTCALLSNGQVRCWGYNIFGQLGLGDTDDRGDDPGEMPTPYVASYGGIIDLASTDTSSCAVTLNGVVRCWGGNMSGELGYGSSEMLGDGPGELPSATVPAGEAVLQLSGGGQFFCAFMYGGDIRCWGSHFQGQLGNGALAGAYGDDPVELPTSPVILFDAPVAMATGANHACMCTAGGEVSCWGAGTVGQLGYEATDNVGLDIEALPMGAVFVDANVVQVTAGEAHTCVLLATNRVRCWGSSEQGQLGYGDTLSVGATPGTMPPPDVDLGGDVVQVAAGGNHTCALMSGGNVRCWGRNASGELGLGVMTGNIGDQGGEMPPGDVALGEAAVTIYAGGAHNCAVLASGAVRCWGENLHGQLGIGSTEPIGDDETPESAPTTPVLP